jgi:transcriptional regulator with XRE-family HTH domain
VLAPGVIAPPTAHEPTQEVLVHAVTLRWPTAVGIDLLRTLAEVLGVHRTYMGGVERGERNLTLRSVERIAESIGVDASTLLHKV